MYGMLDMGLIYARRGFFVTSVEGNLNGAGVTQQDVPTNASQRETNQFGFPIDYTSLQNQDAGKVRGLPSSVQTKNQMRTTGHWGECGK